MPCLMILTMSQLKHQHCNTQGQKLTNLLEVLSDFDGLSLIADFLHVFHLDLFKKHLQKNTVLTVMTFSALLGDWGKCLFVCCVTPHYIMSDIHHEVTKLDHLIHLVTYYN